MCRTWLGTCSRHRFGCNCWWSNTFFSAPNHVLFFFSIRYLVKHLNMPFLNTTFASTLPPPKHFPLVCDLYLGLAFFLLTSLLRPFPFQSWRIRPEKNSIEVSTAESTQSFSSAESRWALNLLIHTTSWAKRRMFFLPVKCHAVELHFSAVLLLCGWFSS